LHSSSLKDIAQIPSHSLSARARLFSPCAPLSYFTTILVLYIPNTWRAWGMYVSWPRRIVCRSRPMESSLRRLLCVCGGVRTDKSREFNGKHTPLGSHLSRVKGRPEIWQYSSSFSPCTCSLQLILLNIFLLLIFFSIFVFVVLVNWPWHLTWLWDSSCSLVCTLVICVTCCYTWLSLFLFFSFFLSLGGRFTSRTMKLSPVIGEIFGHNRLRS
jgi:hypothetical protein